MTIFIKFHKKLPTIDQMNQLLIDEALRRTNGDKNQVAGMLEISKNKISNYYNRKIALKICRLSLLILLFTCLSSFAADINTYVDGQVMVKFKEGVSRDSINELIRNYGLTIREEIPQINYCIFNIPHTYTVEKIVSLLNTLEIVRTCEPVYLSESENLPNDTYFSYQWGLYNQTNENKDTDMIAALALENGSPDVIIAVIDMGFDYAHEDLQANIWNNPGEIPGNGVDDDNNGYIDDIVGWDFVNRTEGLEGDDYDWQDADNDPTSLRSTHGNGVLGVIGATANNEIGISGVAGNCKIMLLRAGFFKTDGTQALSAAYIAKSIIFAADNGARVINISSGSTRYSESYKSALEYAIDKGVVIISSAGNNGTSEPVYPAAYDLPGLISVGASDSNDELSSFSSRGDWVDVSAPGENIMTTLTDNAYGKVQGTSFAAPMVAGIVALVVSRYPEMTPSDVQDKIMNTVDVIENLADANITSGRVNAYRALYNPDMDNSPDSSSDAVNLYDSSRISNTPEAENSDSGDSGGGCFISSAEYGSLLPGLFLMTVTVLIMGIIRMVKPGEFMRVKTKSTI